MPEDTTGGRMLSLDLGAEGTQGVFFPGAFGTSAMSRRCIPALPGW